MNSFEIYQRYVALKAHFTRWDYDYFHFSGRTKANVGSFNKRADRQWFSQLANKHSPFERMLAHFALDNTVYIRDVVKNDDIYLDWQARIDSLSKVFTEELALLKQVFHENFLFTPGHHPYLIREYLGGRISLETLTIISDMTSCVSYWGLSVEDDPLFEQVIMRIVKYSPFLKYDQKKFEKILGSRVDVTT